MIYRNVTLSAQRHGLNVSIQLHITPEQDCPIDTSVDLEALVHIMQHLEHAIGIANNQLAIRTVSIRKDANETQSTT